MERRSIVRVGLATLAFLAALAVPEVTLAGGVSVSVDSMPADVEAGKPFKVGFMISSAHEGREPITGLEPAVLLNNPATNESVTELARAEGDPGHYAATITLSSAGEWRWQIQPFGPREPEMMTTQPPLQVRAPGEAAAPAKAAPTGATQEVGMGDSFFEPRTLTIAAGTTVTWTNGGKMPHTVTAADGRFASGNMDSGDTFSHTFAEPGTYQYYCEYHAARPQGSAGGIVLISQPSKPAVGGGGGHMVGTITVTAAPRSEAPAQGQEAQSKAPVQPETQFANVAPAQQGAQAAGVAPAQPTMPGTGIPGGAAIGAAGLALLALVLGLALRRRREGATR